MTKQKKNFSNHSSVKKNEIQKQFVNDKNVTQTTIFLNVLRFLKTFSNVIITNKMHLFKKRVTIFRIDVVVQLNEKAKCNIIKKQFVVINEMKKISNEFSLFSYMNDHIFYCYDAYKIRCEFVDN